MNLGTAALESRANNRLRRFLSPRDVAVIGGGWGEEVVRQCRKMSYPGKLWVVHPKRAELCGVPCVPTIADLPAVPDAAFVAVNRHAAIEAVRQLSEVGCGGAVVIASGFSEMGNTELQAALVDAAGGMPFQGPNCFGYLNYLDRVPLWPDQHGGMPVERGIGIITQSGQIAISLTMQQRSAPIAQVITLGNQASCGVADFIAAMLDEPRITAIGLIIEGIVNIQAFEAVAWRALTRGVPVVALKCGRSETGARLTISHTSTLAGADDLYDAIFERYAIRRVRTLPVFLETLKLLSRFGPLPGNRVVSLSCSGGEAAMVADLGAERELDFRPFSEIERSGLRETLDTRVHLTNPLDYNTYVWGQADNMRAAYAAAMRGDFDLAMLVHDYPAPDRCDPRDWDIAADAWITASAETGQRAVAVCSMTESLPPAVQMRLAAGGVVPMFGLDEALEAIEGAAWIGARQRADAGRASSPNHSAPALAGAPMRILGEWESKQLLKAYGVAVPEGRLTSAAEAPSVASAVGFPVAVKVAGNFAHKTELAGVRLNLQSEVAVTAAVAGMRHLSESFLVEPMVKDVLAELIVGANRDPQFGLFLVIGAGGMLVELAQDTRILLLPASNAEIIGALSALQIAPLLHGFRGRPKVDLGALVETIQAIAGFVLQNRDRLQELDVNPLLVCKDRAVAADALIRMAEIPDPA